MKILEELRIRLPHGIFGVWNGFPNFHELFDLNGKAF